MSESTTRGPASVEIMDDPLPNPNPDPPPAQSTPEQEEHQESVPDDENGAAKEEEEEKKKQYQTFFKLFEEHKATQDKKHKDYVPEKPNEKDPNDDPFVFNLAEKARMANCSVDCKTGEHLAPRKIGIKWAACCTKATKVPEPSMIYLEIESHLLLTALRDSQMQIKKIQRSPKLIRALDASRTLKQRFEVEISILQDTVAILVERIDYCSSVAKRTGFPGTLVAGCSDLAEIAEQLRGMLIHQSKKVNEIASRAEQQALVSEPQGIISSVQRILTRVWDYLKDLFLRISDTIQTYAKNWVFSDAPLIAYYAVSYILPIGVKGLAAMGAGLSLPGVLTHMMREFCPIIKSLPATLVIGKMLVTHARGAAAGSPTGKVLAALKGSLGEFAKQFAVLRFFSSASGIVGQMSVAAIDDISKEKQDWFNSAVPWLISAMFASVGSLFTGIIEGFCQSGSGAATMGVGVAQLFNSLVSGVGTVSGTAFEKAGTAMATGAKNIEQGVDTLNAGGTLRNKFANMADQLSGESQGLLQSVMEAMALLGQSLVNGIGSGMQLFAAGITGQSLSGIIFVGALLLLAFDHFLAPAVVERLDAYEGLEGREIDPVKFFAAYKGAPAADFNIFQLCQKDENNTRDCAKVTADILTKQRDDARQVALFNSKYK